MSNGNQNNVSKMPVAGTPLDNGGYAIINTVNGNDASHFIRPNNESIRLKRRNNKFS